jgi:CubicO group peptidase (beta-lactamase class C family)
VGELDDAVDDVVRSTGFAGVVRVDVEGQPVLTVAHGQADRAHAVPNRIDTRFGIASATKGLTALTVVSLVVDGTLHLSTPARELLGDDLPLIDDGVTVEHLLAHTSGIGDYLDEEAGGDITDYVLTVPVHRLGTTEAYLEVLDGFPQRFPPGERFSYCNGGYVVLALLAERAVGAGTAFADLVRDRVCTPAGMTGTAFLRSDELPGDAALGYLHPEPDLRTNVHHLPVVGSGDGGAYSTVGDIHRLWRAVDAGDVVPAEWVHAMRAPRHEVPGDDRRYGLGFWLHRTGPAVLLEGYDAGVSFRSSHDPTTGTTWTVVSNTSHGAWPVAKAVAALR